MVAVFICAVFYGDLYVGITVPAAILLLPVIVVLRLICGDVKRAQLPLGLILLSTLALSVATQAALGRGPRGKTDLVVYLPLVYAGLVMVALVGMRVPERYLQRGFAAGGILCAALLAGTLLLAGATFYFVPGQDPAVAPEKEKEVRDLIAREAASGRIPETTSPQLTAQGIRSLADADAIFMAIAQRAQADGVFTQAERDELVNFAKFVGSDPRLYRELQLRRARGLPDRAVPAPDVPTPGGGMRRFYTIKNRVRIPLGMSNYLAVMFVFLFNVMLYQRSRLVFLFALLTACTLSRAGLCFLLISVVFWLSYQRGRLRQLVLASAVAAVVGAIVVAVFWSAFRKVPGAESVASRVWYVQTALAPIQAHPLVGTPRSETVRLFGYPLTWNPHNSVLQLLVLFGIIGALAYAAYLTVVLRTLIRRAGGSALWRGIAAGTAVTLVWSLVEVIILTAAFEMLLGTLYVIAGDTPPERESPS